MSRSGYSDDGGDISELYARGSVPEPLLAPRSIS